MTTPIELKKGEPCPSCGGVLVARKEPDSAAEKIKDAGELYKCAGCGYLARLK